MTYFRHVSCPLLSSPILSSPQLSSPVLSSPLLSSPALSSPQGPCGDVRIGSVITNFLGFLPPFPNTPILPPCTPVPCTPARHAHTRPCAHRPVHTGAVHTALHTTRARGDLTYLRRGTFFHNRNRWPIYKPGNLRCCRSRCGAVPLPWGLQNKKCYFHTQTARDTSPYAFNETSHGFAIVRSSSRGVCLPPPPHPHGVRGAFGAGGTMTPQGLASLRLRSSRE